MGFRSVRIGWLFMVKEVLNGCFSDRWGLFIWVVMVIGGVSVDG